MTDEPVCAVCRRRRDWPVCQHCRRQIRDQLDALPNLAYRLTFALVPGPGSGERVSTSRQPPLPVRLTALTLAAGGSDDARCVFVPKVRVWTETVQVERTEFDADGQPHTVTEARIQWHREPVYDERGRPVMVLSDDQVGTLSIRAWLREWCADWRAQFGHSDGAVQPARKWHVDDAQPPSVEEQARVLLGLGPALAPAARPDDPVAEEWQMRWERTPDRVAGADYRYLKAWLEHAYDEHPRISEFAASLRALVAAIRAVLEDVDVREYLGRCPEEFVDRASGEVTICGAALWHDADVAVIVCPRCRTETPMDRRIWLARRILDTWPIDHRRRYTRYLIEKVLRLPVCACGATVDVEWVEATERQDRERFWRPGRVTCPNGCELA